MRALAARAILGRGHAGELDAPACTGLKSLTSVTWQPHGHLLAVTERYSAIDVLDADAPDTMLWSIEAPVHGLPAWSPDSPLIVINTGEVSFTLIDNDDVGPIAIKDARTGTLVRVQPAEYGYGHVLHGWPTPRHLLTSSFTVDAALVLQG